MERHRLSDLLPQARRPTGAIRLDVFLAPDKQAGQQGCETLQVGYLDEDGDGVGDARVEDCVLPDSAVDRSGDCDDQDASVYPGASERCDGVDEDCDSLIDESPVDGVPTYSDDDGDGYGAGPPMVVCPSDAVVDNADDCDDSDAATNPGAEDTCAGADNDCDGRIDEDAPVVTGFEDIDGHGHEDPDRPVETCESVEVVAVGDDCDDANAAVSPSTTEICSNGIDDDCDGGAAGCLPAGNPNLATEGTLVAATTGSEYASRDFAAGDVDGDRVDDLWVATTGRGRTFLMMGPITADTDLGQAVARLENGTQAGVGMAMGDLDGDGFADLLAGDIWDGPYDQHAGGAWWLPGPVSGVLELDDAATGKVDCFLFPCKGGGCLQGRLWGASGWCQPLSWAERVSAKHRTPRFRRAKRGALTGARVGRSIRTRWRC